MKWKSKDIEKAYYAGCKDTRKEIIDKIKEQIKRTPFPRDIFVEPTREQWRRVAELFEDNGFIQDKYFGSEARRVWKLALEELLKSLEDTE